MQPSNEELGDLSLACERLWHLDSNRAEPGRDYQLNLQVPLPRPQQHRGLPLRRAPGGHLRSGDLHTLLQATCPSLTDITAHTLCQCPPYTLMSCHIQTWLSHSLPAQAAKKGFNPADVALQPLFTWVSPELLRQRRTYALFFALLDNYHRYSRCS